MVAIERGPWRDTATDFNIGYAPDELRYAVRKDLFLQPGAGSHDHAQHPPDGAADARLRLFLPGTWRRRRGRALERPDLALSTRSIFVFEAHLTQRYGAGKFEDLQIQDWGVT